jgi:hypothetical protein
MNRTPWLTLSLICGLVFAMPALGQVPAAALPAEVKEQTDANRHRRIIEQFVAGQVELLLRTDDPSAQAAARDILVNETLHNAQPAPPAFLDVYANEVNRALMGQVVGHQAMRVRLLGAIVAARVAERASNTRLVPSIDRFLADQSPAVVLWGVKGVRGTMPAAMRESLLLRRENPLVEPMVNAVERFPSGPMTQEAYEAFIMDILTNPRVSPDLVQAVVAPVQRILAIRLQQYRDEKVEDPMSENRATLLLTAGHVWGVQSGAQQVQTVQMTLDLLWLAAHLAAAQPGDRDRLIPVVKQSGRALWVVGHATGNVRLQQLAQEAIDAGVNDPPPVLRQMADNVHAGIRGVFNGLQPPQAVDAAARN